MPAPQAATLQLTIHQGIELKEVKTIGKSSPYCVVELNRSELARTNKVKGSSPVFDLKVSVPCRSIHTDTLRFVVHSDNEKVMGEVTVSVASILPGAGRTDRWLKLEVVDIGRTEGLNRGTLKVSFQLPYLPDQHVLVRDEDPEGPWTLAQIVRNDPLAVLLPGSSEPQPWERSRVKPATAQDKEERMGEREANLRERESDLKEREEALREKEEEMESREEHAEELHQRATDLEARAAEVERQGQDALAAAEEREKELEEKRARFDEEMAAGKADAERRGEDLRKETALLAERMRRAEEMEVAQRKEDAASAQQAAVYEAQVRDTKAELEGVKARAGELDVKVDKYRQALAKQQENLKVAVKSGTALEDKLKKYRKAVEKLRGENTTLREKLIASGETLDDMEASSVGATSPCSTSPKFREPPPMDDLSMPASPQRLPSSGQSQDFSSPLGNAKVDSLRVSLRRLIAVGEPVGKVQLQELLELLESSFPTPVRRANSRTHASPATSKAGLPQLSVEGEGAPRSPCPSSVGGLSSSAMASVGLSEEDAIARLEAFHRLILGVDKPRADLSALWHRFRDRPRELHEQLSEQLGSPDHPDIAWLLNSTTSTIESVSPPAGSLEVILESAGPLQEVKRFGTSSPHCVLELAGTMFRSKPAEKTLTPIYDETFRFPFARSEREVLKLEIFSGKTSMGTCTVPDIRNIPCGELVSRLVDLKGPKEGWAGSVRLRLRALGSSDTPEGKRVTQQ